MEKSDEIQRLCEEARLLRSRANAVAEVVSLNIYRLRSLRAARQELVEELRKASKRLAQAAASSPRSGMNSHQN